MRRGAGRGQELRRKAVIIRSALCKQKGRVFPGLAAENKCCQGKALVFPPPGLNEVLRRSTDGCQPLGAAPTAVPSATAGTPRAATARGTDGPERLSLPGEPHGCRRWQRSGCAGAALQAFPGSRPGERRAEIRRFGSAADGCAPSVPAGAAGGWCELPPGCPAAAQG